MRQKKNSFDLPAFLNRRQFSLLSAASLLHLFGQERAFAGQVLPSTQPSTQHSTKVLAPIFPLTEKSADSFTALMAYDPSADPDAVFFRSLVARARRIEPFAATQAHRKLSTKPQLATLTGCYSALGTADEKIHYKNQRYGIPPEGGVYVSRLISYHDIMVSWSGPGIIPNPAMTDAAHRNGALCLGTIFQPDHRIFDASIVSPQQVAAKLVDLAVYFGFDGYFMNFELGTPKGHKQILDLLALMHEEANRRGKRDFYIQFYDGSSDMSQLMPLKGPAASFADSAMLDQGWSGYSMTHGCCSGEPVDPKAVFAYCAANNLDPYEAAYFGYQLYPGPGYFGLSAPDVIHPNDSAYAYGSLQIYSFDDGLHTMQQAMHRDAATSASAREQEEQYYELERQFFSGQSGNPALDNAPGSEQSLLYSETAEGKRRYTDYSAETARSTDQVRLPITYGVANFTVEHSVIGAFPFLTRFNLGAGQAFFIDGVRQGTRPWFNMGIQDLLPTWQWWMEPMHRALDRSAQHYAPLTVQYDQALAFDGGASLHITGSLHESVALRLYKTKLAVLNTENMSLQVVWKAEPKAARQLSIGLLMQDAPDKPVWIRFGDVSRVSHQALAEGWTRTSTHLATYKGRTIAAILFGFHHDQATSARTVFDLHIGEIYAGAPADASHPPAPSGFTVEAFSVDGERLQARLRWQMRDEDAYYDLFHVISEGNIWLGRVYADCYYADDISPEPGQPTKFELFATSRHTPLSRSQPAQVMLAAF
jgi:endo-beta-N-acetylglucosaminidase D